MIRKKNLSKNASNCILVNYANSIFRKSQKLNIETGLVLGQFKEICAYNPSDITGKFYTTHKEILSHRRGGGYWLWKPYIILKELERLKEDEFLFYSDSGTLILSSIKPIIQFFQDQNLDILCFELPYYEYQYTKRDCFKILDADSDEIVQSKQRLSGYHLWKKSELSINLLQDWVKYVSIFNAVSDEENVLGYDNYEGFIAHRHDQSIFSILTKKYEIPAYRDPSQYGNNYKYDYQNSPFDQFLWSTRKKNESSRKWYADLVDYFKGINFV